LSTEDSGDSRDLFMQSTQFLDDDAPTSNWPNCTDGWFIRMRAERNMVITADNSSNSILYMAQTNANFSIDYEG
jgi:hypothetical protein